MFSAKLILARMLGAGRLPPQRCWPRIARLAEHSKVNALLYDVVRSNGAIGGVPGGILAHLHRAYAVNFARNAFVQEEFRLLAGSFDAAGIPVMPLKGAALLETVYRSRIAVRRLEDVDILVPETEFEAARAVLTRRGYYERECRESDRPARMYFKDGGLFPVHLHRHIVNLGGAYFERYGRLIPMARFWNGAKAGLQFMEPALMLLSLCEHALRHGWARLNLLYDIHRVIEEHADSIEWTECLGTARAWGLSGALFTALSLRHDLFGKPAPALAQGIGCGTRGTRGIFLKERIYMACIRMCDQVPEDLCFLLYEKPLNALFRYGAVRLASR